MSWSRPARFRRVCPLLVDTPTGLRCSANASAVRPFWGRTVRYYGGVALGLYAVAALSVFAFLRTIGYPVSIRQVGLPPYWHEVGRERGWYYAQKSNRAFQEGRTGEGLLYLGMAYEFAPGNYVIGLELAKRYQAAQPGRSDQVFDQLLREHPDKYHATAQDWFRALLARGNFVRIAALAHEEVLADRAHAGVWMRALLFATKQNGDPALLHDLLARREAAAVVWHPLLRTELLVRTGRLAEARRAVQEAWPRGGADDAATSVSQFAGYYRVQTLIDLGEPLAALDLLEQNRGKIDGDTYITLRLDALAAARATRLFERDIEAILADRVSAPMVTTLCAHLIRYPNQAVFERLCVKVDRGSLPLTTETAGAWFGLMCTAGAIGDRERLRELSLNLRQASTTPFAALSFVEAFFRGEMPDPRITKFLPIVPLPIGITYALIERYPAPKPTAGAGEKS